MLRWVTGTFLVMVCIISLGTSDKPGEDKFYCFLLKLKNIMKSFEIRAVRLAVCIFKSEVKWQFDNDIQINKAVSKELQNHLIKKLKRVMKSPEKQLRTTIHCLDRYFWTRIVGVMAGNNYTQCLEDDYERILETFQGGNHTSVVFRDPIHQLVQHIADGCDIGMEGGKGRMYSLRKRDYSPPDCNCDQLIEQELQEAELADVEVEGEAAI